MNHLHPSDIEIQEFVLNRESSEEQIISHIRNCEFCHVKAEEYSLLLKGISKLEKPVFDFDLSTLVLNQLPQTKPKVASDKSLFYFIGVITLTPIFTILYLFRGNFISVFEGFEPLKIGLISITAFCLLAFLIVDIFRKYYNQINALNPEN